MTALILLSTLLATMAAFWGLVGNKISLGSKHVRYSDERLETRNNNIKSSLDILICIAGAVLCSGIVLAITGSWYYTIPGLSGGYFIPKWWRAKQESQRLELLQSQLTDILEQIESAIYGGLNPYQAIEDAVPDMPRPARDIFYEILRRYRTGDTLARAIETVRRETGWEDLKVLSVGMNLYNRIGCDMGIICRHSLEAIEDKESYRAVIGAAVSQNMMSLRILSVLPFVILGAARVISPAFSYPLFNTLEGGIVFVFSTVWIITGNIVTRKIVKNAMGMGV